MITVKIALATNDTSIDGEVSANFGRSKYFIIIEDETNEYRVIENKAANEQGGAGVKAAQTLLDEKVNAVVAYQLGENAGHIFEKAGVEIRKADSNLIKAQIDMYNDLPLMNQFHSGFHGGK